MAFKEGGWTDSCHDHFASKREAPKNPLNRRLGGPQTHSEVFSGQKNLLPLLEIKPLSVYYTLVYNNVKILFLV
jgi:hypothetical protein